MSDYWKQRAQAAESLLELYQAVTDGKELPENWEAEAFEGWEQLRSLQANLPAIDEPSSPELLAAQGMAIGAIAGAWVPFAGQMWKGVTDSTSTIKPLFEAVEAAINEAMNLNRGSGKALLEKLGDALEKKRVAHEIIRDCFKLIESEYPNEPVREEPGFLPLWVERALKDRKVLQIGCRDLETRLEELKKQNTPEGANSR